MAKSTKIKAVPPNPKVEIIQKFFTDPAQAKNACIALDSSLTSTGYTIFNEITGELYAFGRIVTESVKGYDYDDYRVFYIATTVNELAKRYGCYKAIFEDQYGGVNQKTTIQLVQVRTAIAVLLQTNSIVCSYYSPSSIKHGLIKVTKLNTLKKEDIADLVIATYPGYLDIVGPFSDKAGKVKTSDIYDSTSIAMYHCKIR